MEQIMKQIMKQTMEQIEEQNRNQNSKLNPRLNQKLEAVNQVYEMIDDIYDSYAGSFGITDAELWVLYALFEHNGDYLQTDICRQWYYSLQTIHTTIKNMEKKGLITLICQPGNKKNKYIHLTEAGEKMMEEIAVPLTEAEKKAFSALTQEEQDLKYLHPYKGSAIFMIFLLFAQVLGTLYIPTLTAAIVNKGIVTGNVNEVWRIGGMMLAVAILAATVSILETWLSTTTFSAMSRDIRCDLFKKAQAITINEFNRFGPASMITRCTNDITQIQQGYMSATEMLLPAPIMTIAGLVLAFQKNGGMALLIVASMVIVCVIVAAVGSRAMKLFASLQTMLDKINRVLREYLTGIRVIRAFNRSEYEQARTNKTYEEYASTAIRVNRIFAILMPVIMMIMNVCTVILIAVGGQSVANGTMEIGDIMAMIEYAFLILMYLIMGIMVVMIFPRAQTCANRVCEVLELRLPQA